MTTAAEEEASVCAEMTTLVEALQMEGISSAAAASTPITQTPESPLGGAYVVEDPELKVALVDELRNGRPALKTHPESLHSVVYHAVEMIY